jgi:hypothetical protein
MVRPYSLSACSMLCVDERTQSVLAYSAGGVLKTHCVVSLRSHPHFVSVDAIWRLGSVALVCLFTPLMRRRLTIENAVALCEAFLALAAT